MELYTHTHTHTHNTFYQNGNHLLDSHNLKTIEQKIKTAQKPNNQNPSPNNKLFDEKNHAIKISTKNPKTTVGVVLMGDPTTPKHKTKPTSNVPTSDLRHPTSSTAITLVALVITVIVLLILAGVTLNAVMGEGGIIKRAIKAREETKAAAVAEELELIITQAKTELITQGKTNPEPQETALQIQKDQDKKVDMVIRYMPTATVKIEDEQVIQDGIIGEINSIEIEYKDYRFILDEKFRIQKGASKKLSEIKRCKVTFDLKGGEGNFPEKPLEKGRKLGKEEPTKQGYAFTGWNTKEDGSRKNVQSRRYMGRRKRHKAICDVECNII